MRSSKSRSRSKGNRSRSMGNIVNRVFDSSGPEGKVRGTPQQIIDKYVQLARDAQLGNDRVAAENFQQHAEHYTRMLGEAQREQDARQQQQQQEQRDRQQQRDDERQQRGDDQPDQPQEGAGSGSGSGSGSGAGSGGSADDQDGRRNGGLSDVMDVVGDEPDTGLVETPENTAPPKPRRKRTTKKAADKTAEAEPADAGADPKAAE